MKKFIVLLLILVALVSCKRDYETTITYKVYYPNNVVVRQYTESTTENPTYLLGSDRGSNYLFFNWNGTAYSAIKLEDTSAPIEVISFVKTKKII